MFRVSALFLLFVLGPISLFAQMQAEDVQLVLRQAAARARQISPNSVIAVVDREGYVLGVWAAGTVPAKPANRANKIATAISKAGTAAFLSSNEEALTTRTAGFIVQQHFPPGVANRPPGPLVGVNFSNLPFSGVNRFKDPSTFQVRPGTASGPGGKNGAPIANTSLAGSPGGVPLFKDGRLIGGIGVTGDGSENIQVEQMYDIDEDIALAGQTGYEPNPVIAGSNVFIDGIRVAYLNSSTEFVDPSTVPDLGAALPEFPIRSSPNVTYPVAMVGGVVGEIRIPFRADPRPGLVNGQPRLTAREVRLIIAKAAHQASKTRAGIRLPTGKAAQVFISVVGMPDQPGKPAPILGTFRTPDATMFSWDVSVQKARTAVFFSNNKRAFSTRTVGFLAQSFYPPGIIATAPGPFLGLQERFSGFSGFNSLNGAFVGNPLAGTPPNPNLPNGITIFPGGFPLYRNGVLIGAIGVSGDGVDQDDIIGAAGTVDYRPPRHIHSQLMEYRGARLPYAKFPRNPEL